jgi:HEPN domain-containing protein
MFHSQLAAIFKQYLSRIYQQPYLSKTTREILLLLKEQQVEEQLLNKVLISLHYGDAVKFAKYFPPVNESEHCLKLVEELVEEIKKLKETSKP